jgi:two-component system, cell cycle sensor histidine kinase and response regulator CckA
MRSTKKYQMLFENSKDAVCITTPKGRYLDINPAGVELFGYESKEEMLGLNINTDIFADPEARKLFTKKLGEDGYVKDYRIELKRKDGKRLITLITATAVRDEKGNIVEYHGIHHEITGREQEREALREDLDRLDLALKTADMGVWYWDIINRKIHFDEKTCRMLGIEPSTFRGTREEFYSAVHPEDRERVRSRLYRRVELNDIPHKTEYRVIWPDGSVHYIAGQGRVIRDENGIPLKMQGVHWDITEQKQAAITLAESEERFKYLVHNSNDVIILLDENGIQTFTCGPVERILGYKSKSFLGIGFRFELVHPDDLEPVKKVFDECLRQPGSVRTIEYQALHKNGKWITLEAVGANLLHDPVVKGVVINLRDISDRNKLQEQLQQAMKMEAIGRLAGGVAHDFNNLLTVISGNIELARMDLNPSDPLVLRLNNIMRASESATSLTRQLLAFSRKQIIEPRVLNLNELVRNVRQMLMRLIGENIELSSALSKDLGAVRIDPGQFEQVLVNLVVNARDAMPSGGKLIIETANITLDENYCATHSQVQPGKFIMLAVSDTGHGMSEDVKKLIFEPFFTTKSNGHGTGLGLPTIFGIVQQAGGIIECYSEEGRGTTFKIYLPVTEKQPERLVRERRSIDRLKGNETILLVEDEACVRDVAMMILKDLGYKAIEAHSGEEALMLAEKHIGRIHLLMTDVVMPGMNGKELSERLTKLQPEMKTLYCSGYTENIIVHHGVVDASINFIGKPYSMQALAGKIREVLDTATK